MLPQFSFYFSKGNPFIFNIFPAKWKSKLCSLSRPPLGIVLAFPFHLLLKRQQNLLASPTPLLLSEAKLTCPSCVLDSSLNLDTGSFVVDVDLEIGHVGVSEHTWLQGPGSWKAFRSRSDNYSHPQPVWLPFFSPFCLRDLSVSGLYPNKIQIRGLKPHQGCFEGNSVQGDFMLTSTLPWAPVASASPLNILQAVFIRAVTRAPWR